ncbi:MAG: alanine racemase [Ilumatobacteraceae bacterium]
MRTAKGLPLDGADPVGRKLGRDPLGTPVAVLRRSALERNAATMQRYCEQHGVLLFPHAKTTMAPELVALQLAHGAAGMTAAVPWQAAQLWEWGVRDVLIANEVTDVAALTELLVRREDGRTLRWYVDSAAAVELAIDAVRAAGGPPGEVLVELAGGRTGAMTVDDAVAVARLVAAAPELRLGGLATFEGSGPTGRGEAALAHVDELLGRVAATARILADAGMLATTTVAGRPASTLLTAGGSIHFDRVVDVLGSVADELGGVLVLRSGCYLTHDHGIYARTSPAVRPGWSLPAFEAAIEVWGHVLSRNQPDRAFVDAGRRDVSFDAGLPVPLRRIARDGTLHACAGWSVDGLADQHSYISLPGSDRAAPGDLVGFGISHPCTTFDKWERFLVVDDDDVVVSVTGTSFGESVRPSVPGQFSRSSRRTATCVPVAPPALRHGVRRVSR